MGEFCRGMEHAVDTMPAENLCHAITISYVGLNRLEIRVAVLVFVDVYINNTIAAFEQPPFQDGSEKAGSPGNDVSLHN
jgi:hypothetical protein